MFLLLFSVICLLGWVVRRIGYTHSFKLPPRYPGWLPLIGHLHYLFRHNPVDIWRFYKQLSRESLKKGGVMTFSLGPENFYLITDPDDAYTASRACLEKHYLYKLVKPWLGDGLLTADVATWKVHRKLINLAFTQKMLNGLLVIFNAHSRRLVEHLNENIGQTFDPEPLLLDSNLKIVCETSMAVDATEHKEIFDKYVKSIREMYDIIFQRFIRYWFHSDYIFSFSDLKRKQDVVVEGLHKLSDTVLQKRKSKLLAAKDKLVTDNFTPLMDTILEMSLEKGLLTDKQTRENLDTILFGGHDTSITSLTCTLALLGSDQKRQDKVFQEITEVMGSSLRDVDKDDLPKLIYLECVIKESLRLYPIAPFFPRVTSSDLKLKNYTLPSGSTCVIDSWGIHRHPVWGPDAEEFRPERWLEPETLPDMNQVYGAFGVGRRTCIGKSYAMMSMKVFLVHMLRRYKVTADISNLTLMVDLLLRPHSGRDIKIELRN